MKYLTVFVHGEVHVISRKDRLKRNIWKRYLKPPYGPNGGNNQSWLFTAIQNKDILSKINELLREGFQYWTPDDDYPGKLGAKAYAQREDCHFFHHAPTLIIASNRPNYENAMADCALALENLFLAAQSLRLGSCSSILCTGCEMIPNYAITFFSWESPKNTLSALQLR